jgi:hypothetical protein
MFASIINFISVRARKKCSIAGSLDPKIRKEWPRSSANEFRRTMQGVGKNRPKGEETEGTDTMHFIKKRNLPKGKKVTYARFISEIRLQKQKHTGPD